MTIPKLLSLPADRPFPNNPMPVRLYPGALKGARLANEIEQLFKLNGWQGTWRNGIMDRHHFHATAHEVLGCARGTVEVLLGGPNGEKVTLRAGDIAVLPAGVSHKNVGHSSDYLIVGAYPQGQSADFEYGDDEHFFRALASIEEVPLPHRDPVTGLRFDDLPTIE